MSAFDQVFFKVAPRDFAAFVYDTNDLSITRGGSITLLEMPLRLFGHLVGAFPKFRFGLIQGAASELFFSVEGEAGKVALDVEPIKPTKPGGVKQWEFEGALNSAVEELRRYGFSEENLALAVATMAKTKPGKRIARERLPGMILFAWQNEPTDSSAPISDQDADSIEKEIRAFLRAERDGWPFDLLRFGVARYRPDPGDADSAKPGRIVAALETALGRERAVSLSCPVPSSPGKAGQNFDKVVCSYTRRLQADGGLVKNRPASKSAARRYTVGRDAKRKRGVYERVLDRGLSLAGNFDGAGLATAAVELVTGAGGLIGDARTALDGLPEFANDFQQIVADPPGGLSLSAGSGLCLLRMDGNGFGKLRAGQRDLASYRRLADYLDILKARLMARIVSWLAERPDLAVTLCEDDEDADRTRFETLLWGGDEFAFVCPAWAGWSLARTIAGETGAWVDLDGKALTFGTGIGFAHHKIPIAQFLDAVEALEDAAKQDKTASRVLALSWEGVDRVHLRPEGYMARLYGDEKAAEKLAFPASDLGQWVAWKNRLLQAVGRSALHRWAGFGREYGADGAWSQVAKEMERIGTGDGQKLLEEIAGGGNGQVADDHAFLRLKQILFLLDYLVYLEPEMDTAAADEAAA